MPRSLGKEQMTKSAVAGTVKFKSLHKWNKLQTGWNTWKMSGQCKKDRLSWTIPDLTGNVMTVRLPVMTSSTRVIFVMFCWLSYKPINNLITTHCPAEWTKGGQWPTLTWTHDIHVTATITFDSDYLVLVWTKCRSGWLVNFQDLWNRFLTCWMSCLSSNQWQ